MASKEFFRSPAQGSVPRPVALSSAPSVLVPIRSIGPRHTERIAAHLLALEPRDRYLRFGYSANDEQIRRYVEGLDFERQIFGALKLLAMFFFYSDDRTWKGIGYSGPMGTIRKFPPADSNARS